MNRVDVETRYVQLCESYVGCSAPSARFLDLVAPHGPPDARAHFGAANVPKDANSGCGVVAVGLARELFRALGVPAPELEVPLGLDWWARFVALAKRLGCYRTGGVPVVGWLYHVESAAGRHWRSVVRGSSAVLGTVDGGSKTPAGHQTIVRALVQIDGQRDVTSGKPIVDLVDVVGMALALLDGDHPKSSEPPMVSPKTGSQTITPSAAISSPRTASSAASDGGKAIAELAGPVEGIDVSSDNGVIVWAKVPSEVRFVVVRAQLGVDQRDTMLMANANGARSTGRELAVYGLCLPGHWDPTTRQRLYEATSDAERQARQLAVCHREAGATLKPWVDVEPTKTMLAAHVSGRAWALCARIYLETLEAEGLPPMVYTNGGWWDSVPELRDELFARWPLAGSDYRGLELPFTPRPWVKTTIYQYAAGDPAGVVGRVAGVPTVVDRDRVIDGTLAALRL